MPLPDLSLPDLPQPDVPRPERPQSGVVRIRERTPHDLPVLGRVLAAQQPHTGYPQRWPLPWPVESFLQRQGELGAWVATLGDADVPVGHVSVTAVTGDGPEVEGWVAGTRRPVEDLAAVSVLFVDHEVSGAGVGRALLEASVTFIRGSGRVPVLDVVQETDRAVRLYRRAGWQVVGEARPSWLPDTHRPVLLMALPEA